MPAGRYVVATIAGIAVIGLPMGLLAVGAVPAPLGSSPGTPATGAADVKQLGSLKDGEIPAPYRKHIAKAGATCPEISAPIIAAQIAQESGWRADAVSPAGAVGLTQFMPGTWQAWGVDANSDGKTDPRDPADAIAAQAKFDCHLAKAASGWVKDGIVTTTTDVVDLTLASYNAGPGAVLKYGGIPPYNETQNYVKVINASARQKFAKASA